MRYVNVRPISEKFAPMRNSAGMVRIPHHDRYTPNGMATIAKAVPYAAARVVPQSASPSATSSGDSGVAMHASYTRDSSILNHEFHVVSNVAPYIAETASSPGAMNTMYLNPRTLWRYFPR